ncbi:MAG: YkgJ family cysteine cluster protein [Chloroflexi bacterium]|nr:YkgJ family cysteine cluster protein [Chloroflexota bacterium]
MTTSVTLTTADGRQCRIETAPEAGTTTATAAPIPCFQCGLCCIKWQPLLDPAEIRRLAADLGLSARTFRRRYVRPYPLRRGWGMLKTGTVGCTFLAFRDGRSFCSIYQVRPQVCRDWAAGLDKPECRQGLQRMGNGRPLTLGDLYPDAADRAAFAQAVAQPPTSAGD